MEAVAVAPVARRLTPKSMRLDNNCANNTPNEHIANMIPPAKTVTNPSKASNDSFTVSTPPTDVKSVSVRRLLTAKIAPRMVGTWERKPGA